MSTRDPFLDQFRVVFDRFMAWLILSAASTLVWWTVVWERGFLLSFDDAWRLFLHFVTGNADRPATIVGLLTVAVALLISTMVAATLFAKWNRQGLLRAEHIRGSRLGG